MNLDGRRALVTGGGRGIGPAVALRLADAGAYGAIKHGVLGPTKVAALALLPCGGEARGITGQALNVDGGTHV